MGKRQSTKLYSAETNNWPTRTSLKPGIQADVPEELTVPVSMNNLNQTYWYILAKI